MSSGFISEKDLAEAKQRRQEEWEKVRNPDQPIECPEEPYDGRSLFERLREQKMKKDMEYDEAHKLKNLIRGLDDDEVQFLELVDRSKLDAEKKIILEDQKEIKEFRNRVATLQEESENKKIQSELKQAKSKSTNSRPSQKALIGVSIKRKHEDSVAKAHSRNDSSGATSTSNTTSNSGESDGKMEMESSSSMTKEFQVIATNEFNCGALKCVAILPGIGPYKESSDSEISSGSEDEPEECGKYDLVGRTIKKKKQCDEDC